MPFRPPAPEPEAGSEDREVVAAALRIVLSYAGFAALWVLATEVVVPRLASTRRDLPAGDGPEWVFMAVSSVILFGLLKRSFRQLGNKSRQVRQEVRRGNQRFETLFRLSPIAIVLSRADDGRILEANDAFLRLIGLDRKDVIGRQSTDLGLFADSAQRALMLDAVARQGAARGQMVRLPSRSGQETTAALSAALIEMWEGPCILATLEDVEERTRAAELLRLASEQLQRFVRQAPIAVAMLDREMNYLAMSDLWLLEHGTPGANLVGRNHYQVLPDQPEYWREIHMRCLAGESLSNDGDFWMRADGEQRWHRWVVTPWIDDAGAVGGIIICFENITARIRDEERIAHLATHDPLTNLPNMALMNERISRALELSIDAGRQCAILLVDLDQFRFINDSFGHDFGDKLLQAAAVRLAACVHKLDCIGRRGGDEFVILPAYPQRRSDTYLLAQQLVEAFQRPLQVEGKDVIVTASIGISFHPEGGSVVDTLLANADVAMYRAKTLGRNAYQVFTTEMSEASRLRTLLEGELRLALQRDQLSLLYQPRIQLSDGSIIGCEALLRWQHPELGGIPPAQFIPLAEETGLIIDIGDWVLRAACRQSRAWQDEGLPDIVVSVNLSTRQFRRQNVPQWVEDVLLQAALDPARLELELTESLLADDIENVIASLGELRRMGVQLSIDDFGTGFSSLAYLTRLRVETLKIDQSFIRNMLNDQDDATVALAIIALAHSLRMSVVAEGVEHHAQCDFLYRHGCDAIQGYLFSGPVPPDELASMLRSGRRLAESAAATVDSSDPV